MKITFFKPAKSHKKRYKRLQKEVQSILVDYCSNAVRFMVGGDIYLIPFLKDISFKNNHCRVWVSKWTFSLQDKEDFMMPTNRKHLAIYAPPAFPYTGTEVRAEIDAFFQFCWDNTDAFEKYAEIAPKNALKVIDMLSNWDSEEYKPYQEE